MDSVWITQQQMDKVAKPKLRAAFWIIEFMKSHILERPNKSPKISDPRQPQFNYLRSHPVEVLEARPAHL